jgi:radical SAM superfamily enzyme YgiQ (UPF0313 family)
MKILLVNPPSKGTYPPMFPLGLSYIAGVLLNLGYKICVWDLNVERWSQDEIRKKLSETCKDYALIGIGALTGDYPFVEWFCKTIRQYSPQTKIILGGYLASALPQFLMEQLPIDYVAVGEAEETIKELMPFIENRTLPSEVKGIYYRDAQGQIQTTGARPRNQNLDTLPLPTWDYFSMKQYLKEFICSSPVRDGKKTGGVMSIMASRGCPFNCIYCDHTIKGYQVRYRSVESIVHEIQILLKKYDKIINHFYFWDDILIDDPNWVFKFCDRLKREGLNIKWTCNCHVNKVEPRLMAYMKDAGCYNVRFGIESGSQKILNALNKGVIVEKALESLRICLDAGLSLTIYLMVGMEGENTKTIDETLAFLRKLITPSFVDQSAEINFFMLTPFPGTRLFEKLREQGLITNISSFLNKGLDAYNDLPLNISGQSEEELRNLKNRLETSVSEIIVEQRKQFHELLFSMKRELQK